MKETALNYGMNTNGTAVENSPLTIHHNTSPMERAEFIKAVKEAFQSNPDAKEFFVTKDGMCFFTEHDAHNHERYLGDHDKGVERFMRDAGNGGGAPGSEDGGTNATRTDEAAAAAAAAAKEKAKADAAAAAEKAMADETTAAKGNGKK